ncbi:hypothetical protein FDP41_007162 [Naegleria fowleri]|uniref:Uncharacterized protein n=1 Tax=Naegleria fowleri TaxID=5763 RepID=A0A6A5BJG7_NAEFO|nr:uncharacterized protein FDP41_007162 [Naegleria fowleri]KAF0973775.1 hypothetical protein FDP41_007162 [Naegleria fowleri]CAG4709766.1 unnamed protein product [Naegleria fowleri]
MNDTHHFKTIKALPSHPRHNDWNMFTVQGDEVVQLGVSTSWEMWKPSIPCMLQRGFSPSQIATEMTREIVQGVLAKGEKQSSKKRKEESTNNEKENIYGNYYEEKEVKSKNSNPYFEVADTAVRENICSFLLDCIMSNYMN